MSLFRLIYVSTVSEDFQASDIEGLLADYKSNNRQQGITGLLCFNHLYFLQCLEGEERQVRQTFEKIEKDSRHSKIKVIDSGAEDFPMFESWDMGYVFLSRDLKELNMNLVNEESFCPYSMETNQLVQFLLKSKELLITI